MSHAISFEGDARTDEKSIVSEIHISSDATMNASLTESCQPLSEHLMILCREVNAQALQLKACSNGLFASITIISDKELGETTCDGVVFIPDQCLSGLEWMTSPHLSGNQFTAWSRAIDYAMQVMQPGDGVWFIEDDVSIQHDCFARLIEISQRVGAAFSSREISSREDCKNWYWWSQANCISQNALKSFNPLCRCTYEHVEALKRHRELHGCLGFHEISLASIAKDAGLEIFDWCQDAAANACFGEFRFRPHVNHFQRGICHPVKDVRLHRILCSGIQNAESQAASSVYHAPLEFETEFGSWAIDLVEYRWLSRWCSQQRIRKVLEFGPGATSNAFIGAGCILHSWESDSEWLEKHLWRTRNQATISLLPADMLPDENDLPFIPDVIMVDGPPYRQGDEFSRRKECAWAMELCGRFFLHDSKREGEMATLRDYQEEHYQIFEIPSRKGMALVTDLRRHAGLDSSQVGGRLQMYHCTATRAWYLNDYQQWHFWLGTAKPIRALEIGASDGVSANLMLDKLFPHPESRVDCIDPYDVDEGNQAQLMKIKDLFLQNREIGKHAESIHLYEGRSLEVLSWMINHDEYCDQYDFIYIDGAPQAPLVLTDGVLAMNLLKRGGVMIFANYGVSSNGLYESPLRAIDAFIDAYRPHVTVFEKGQYLGLVRCL